MELNRYYTDRLSESDRKNADLLRQKIAEGKREILLPSMETPVPLVCAVERDHPEFFFVNWLQAIRWRQETGGTRVFLAYMYDDAVKRRFREMLQSCADGLAGITKHGKLYAIHSYLALHVSYDSQGLTKPVRSPSMFSAEGPLLDGQGVCEGISKAAVLLARAVGIDCRVVYGRSRRGVAHAWNEFVTEEGHVFSDITYDVGVSPARGFAYFALSRKDMEKDHIFD